MSVMASQPLKAPFPAFGGKSAVAARVWKRLGNVRNYVEPFCFSAAMLLLRPDEPQIETINDVNAYVANFWRAVQHDPEAVAAHADWPVNETDLHARHKWLVHSEAASAELERVRMDPDHYDARIAGWWCWGACMWIGSGWCEERGTNSAAIPMLCTDSNGGHGVMGVPAKMPFIGDRTKFGRGVQAHHDDGDKRPQLCNGSTRYGQGVHKRPILTSDGGTGGKGIHAKMNGRPQLADAYSRGRGIHADSVNGKRPHISNPHGSHGMGIHGGDAEVPTDCDRRRLWLLDWFTRLSDRLRPVRVCCGHWARVCDSDSTLTRLGTTGVFLDPPYRKHLADGTENRAAHIYANDKVQDVGALCDEVQAWCLKWGGNRDIRIAVCGLEGEYPGLDAAGWEKEEWKSRGGYGNRSDRGKENAARERIWYSPNCLRPGGGLFDAVTPSAARAGTGATGGAE